MVTTAPILGATTDKTELAPKAGLRTARGRDEESAEAPAVRRPPGKRRMSRAAEPAVTARYFLTKAGGNGRPELENEMEDENQAMIEALKRDVTFVIVTEWRPKVDGSVKGRPVIEKDPVSRKGVS